MLALQVAAWLDAVLYVSSYRPVPLQEYIKDGRRILDHNYQVCDTFAAHILALSCHSCVCTTQLQTLGIVTSSADRLCDWHPKSSCDACAACVCVCICFVCSWCVSWMSRRVGLKMTTT
jgi:hypothetical protein